MAFEKLSKLLLHEAWVMASIKIEKAMAPKGAEKEGRVKEAERLRPMWNQ